MKLSASWHSDLVQLNLEESQKRFAQPRHSLQSTHSGCFSLFWDVTAVDSIEHRYMLSGGFLIVCFADITHYADNTIWDLFLPLLYLINMWFDKLYLLI